MKWGGSFEPPEPSVEPPLTFNLSKWAVVYLICLGHKYYNLGSQVSLPCIIWSSSQSFKVHKKVKNTHKMKREGRQHGMVRTFRILPSPINPTWLVNEYHSPPTAGLFTKMPSKPTNHSKFTSKSGTPRCTECHTNPAYESKNKTKRTKKLNSRDAFLNTRLVTWNVKFGPSGSSFFGSSATDLLDLLSNTINCDEVYDTYVVYDHFMWWSLQYLWSLRSFYW